MTSLSVRAPGRVELLGNHTDYNDGFVLSAAINYYVTVMGERSDDAWVSVRSSKFAHPVRVPVDGIIPQEEPHSWANYPLGVAQVLRRCQYPVSGFAMSISSDLPSGAGLSSSAALEVATACLLVKMFSLDIAPLDLAKLCRRAENEFVGVQCGLLDQVSSIFGRQGKAVFLDCRKEQVEEVPLPETCALLVFESGAPHRLTGGEYNERRKQCAAAARWCGVPALRDVSRAELERTRAELDPLVYRRALHIVGENERVLAGVELLRQGDGTRFGQLMFASHESSRTNFANSTAELDTLVELARDEPGVLGSRLTGGGFGGATISLVERDHAGKIACRLEERYFASTGYRGRAYLCEAADGAVRGE